MKNTPSLDTKMLVVIYLSQKIDFEANITIISDL